MSDSPTFKVQIPSAEELAKRTPKDFMDAIEFGMISSSQLGKGDDYQLFAGLLDNELGLEQNEEFARLSRVMQDVRKSIVKSTGIKALADLQKSPTYVKFVDEQNAIREQIIKATQPSEAVQSMLDSIAGAGSVLAKHQKIWRDRALEIQQEIENVEVQITKLTPPLEFKDGGRVPTLEELAMQVKSYEIELETKKAELHQCSMFAKELDPVMVSDFHKQLVKDFEQHIDRGETIFAFPAKPTTKGYLCNYTVKDDGEVTYSGGKQYLGDWSSELGDVFYESLTRLGYDIAGDPKDLFNANTSVSSAEYLMRKASAERRDLLLKSISGVSMVKDLISHVQKEEDKRTNARTQYKEL